MPRLSYETVKQYVEQNNNSTFSTALLVCLIWKESGFDTDAAAQGSTARGLMQMTVGAVETVNNTTPPGVHFEHNEMTDPVKAIQCGTYYLAYLLRTWPDPVTALEHYGTGRGYADNILRCELCINTSPQNPQACLNAIHP